MIKIKNYLFFCLCHFSGFLLFCLESFHDIFSLLIFVDHNVRNAQVCNNDGSQRKHVFRIFRHNRLVVSDGLIVSFQDEEYMSYVKFPCFMVCTELGTLPEQFLDDVIVLFVPIDLGLGHEHRDVFFKTVVEFFQWFLDTLIVFGQSCVLDGFCQLSQIVDVTVCDNVELSEGLLRGGLL